MKNKNFVLAKIRVSDYFQRILKAINVKNMKEMCSVLQTSTIGNF